MHLYLNQSESVPTPAEKQAKRLFEKRAARIPLQYLLGTQEFWGLEFEVTPDVFIPRPETELLVEEAIRLIKEGQNRGGATIIELGTGSGCISVALAKELPGTRFFATDISMRALRIASRNACRLEPRHQITFIVGDLFRPFRRPKGRSFSRRAVPCGRGGADLIISNPPYIPSRELGSLAAEIRDHEPRLALDGGEDGLEVCRQIIREAQDYLVPGGTLLLEIGWQQSAPLTEWLRRQAMPWEIRYSKDLAGVERVALLKNCSN